MQPERHIFIDLDSLSDAAAELWTAVAHDAVARRGRFLAALSGGGTPAGLFRRLATIAGLPWPESHFFWGDERLVPPDNDGSNYALARRLLLDHVPVAAAHIHRARGELPPQEAVADYTARLQAVAGPGRAWPRFDLALMGLGSDGHTASLFPGSPVVDPSGPPVQAVTAHYNGRPAHRLTLTSPVFNDARTVLFLVAGAGKAAAVAAVLTGPSQPVQWPAQRIQPAGGRLIWFLDQAAATALPPIT